jgi:hypothetical protein
MVRELGSGERWQSETTRRWIARIVAEHPAAAVVVLEGQVRPSFVESALAARRVATSAIVLFHCDDAEREARLRARGQPPCRTWRARFWTSRDGFGKAGSSIYFAASRASALNRCSGPGGSYI